MPTSLSSSLFLFYSYYLWSRRLWHQQAPSNNNDDHGVEINVFFLFPPFRKMMTKIATNRIKEGNNGSTLPSLILQHYPNPITSPPIIDLFQINHYFMVSTFTSTSTFYPPPPKPVIECLRTTPPRIRPCIYSKHDREIVL